MPCHMRYNPIRNLIAAAVCAALVLSSCAFTNNAEKLPELTVRYAAGDYVQEAVSRLSAGASMAKALTDVRTVRKILFLTFEGLADASTTERLLDLLDAYSIKSTFFLPGIKSAEDPDTVAAIARHGHQIGNYSLWAETRMEKLSAEELTENFARTGAILSDITGEVPAMLKCRATNYTDSVLRAAGAAGAESVLDVRHYLSYQSFRSQEDALEYVLGLERGAVLSFQVDGVLNEYEYEYEYEFIEEVSEGQDTALTVVEDSEGLTTATAEKVASREDRLISAVGYLLEALAQGGFQVLPAEDIPKYEDTDFGISFSDLQAENGGVMSQVLANARTTMRDVGISFRYLGDKDRLDRLLSALEAGNVTATFYVTGKEIEDYPERVEKILEAGHALENGGMSGEDLSNADFEQVSLEIYKCGKMLSELYGIHSKLFMSPGGKITDIMQEAANAQGYTVALYNKNPVAQGVEDERSLAAYFSGGVNRGDIIFGDLERFDQWERFIPYIASMVRGTGYGFKAMAQLLAGQYPLYDVTAIPGWNAIRINDNYNPERPRHDDYIVDVKTDDKVMFLTFDDWGSDKTVTGLLDMLYRYGAKATFFVRANGVELNPNLARAIADQGHDVVSHSYEHRPIVDISAQELQADAVKAHRVLTQTLGQMPPLLYRPPTLDYDDSALNALFATGYRFIMSGFPSTHDYEKTPEEVIEIVLAEAKPGCIPVLHMSDNACAREAISVIIPTLQAQGYTFAKLSDYLK